MFTQKTTCHDQLGRRLQILLPARRIISLVPSQTELLHYLGLEAETVGITRFCVHPPEWFRNKPRIGGTKDFRLDRILSLQPDLILANKEENTQAGIEQLAALFPVYVSNINTIPDALDMIEQVGNLTHRHQQARHLAQNIETTLKKLHRQQKGQGRRTAYLIWRKPYMAVGSQTFIHHMLTHVCGLQNVFAHIPRYPDITIQTLQQLQPQLVLLSSEPYPFKKQHVEELAQVLPHAQICCVDGEMFSWYGSRLLQAADYLNAFLDQI